MPGTALTQYATFHSKTEYGEGRLIVLKSVTKFCIIELESMSF